MYEERREKALYFTYYFCIPYSVPTTLSSIWDTYENYTSGVLKLFYYNLPLQPRTLGARKILRDKNFSQIYTGIYSLQSTFTNINLF